MPRQRNPMIGVIGEGDCDPELYAIAEAVGRLVAEKGADIVCGGLGGVMEGACRGDGLQAHLGLVVRVARGAECRALRNWRRGRTGPKRNVELAVDSHDALHPYLAAMQVHQLLHDGQP